MRPGSSTRIRSTDILYSRALLPGGAASGTCLIVQTPPAATEAPAMFLPPQPPRREPLLYLPVGVVIGFCLAMLVDAILHTALYQPPWRTDPAPLHEMTTEAWADPVSIPRDTFDIPPPP